MRGKSRKIVIEFRGEQKQFEQKTKCEEWLSQKVFMSREYIQHLINSKKYTKIDPTLKVLHLDEFTGTTNAHETVYKFKNKEYKFESRSDAARGLYQQLYEIGVHYKESYLKGILSGNLKSGVLNKYIQLVK